MKIIIYGVNYTPELTGIGKYSGEMSEWLVKQGHEVRVVTAPPYYPEWKVSEGYSATSYSRNDINDVNVFRCPLYVPARPSGLKRIIHLASFALSSFPIMLKQIFWKPDVVMVIEPPLFCAPTAWFVSRLSGGKCWLHVQDFEVDAAFDLGIISFAWMKTSVSATERWLMARFDVVSSISTSMLQCLEVKGVESALFFPNWADVDFVTPEVSGEQLKTEWGFTKEDKIILYAGNMGKKQGLEIVLDAAKKLENNEINFVLAGTGAHIDVLKADVIARGLSNVHFKPLQPWERVPEMLALADIHLVIQKRGAADVVLPSKLTNILSAGGHAIVTAEKDTELGMLAENFSGIYNCIEPESSALLIETVQILLQKDLSQPNKIARDYAIEYLSREKILNRFELDLEELCS
jgi:colanic acid biosynthesis glycosyl transferase WcaI